MVKPRSVPASPKPHRPQSPGIEQCSPVSYGLAATGPPSGSSSCDRAVMPSYASLYVCHTWLDQGPRLSPRLWRYEGLAINRKLTSVNGRYGSKAGTPATPRATATDVTSFWYCISSVRIKSQAAPKAACGSCLSNTGQPVSAILAQ